MLDRWLYRHGPAWLRHYIERRAMRRHIEAQRRLAAAIRRSGMSFEDATIQMNRLADRLGHSWPDRSSTYDRIAAEARANADRLMRGRRGVGRDGGTTVETIAWGDGTYTVDSVRHDADD